MTRKPTKRPKAMKPATITRDNVAKAHDERRAPLIAHWQAIEKGRAAEQHGAPEPWKPSELALDDHARGVIETANAWDESLEPQREKRQKHSDGGKNKQLSTFAEEVDKIVAAHPNTGAHELWLLIKAMSPGPVFKRVTHETIHWIDYDDEEKTNKRGDLGNHITRSRKRLGIVRK